MARITCTSCASFDGAGIWASRDQVRDLLRLSSQEDQACCEVDQITAAHLTEIELKFADLTRLADELHRISSQCQGTGRLRIAGSLRL